MFLGQPQGLSSVQDSELPTFIINHPNLPGADGFIDVRFLSYGSASFFICRDKIAGNEPDSFPTLTKGKARGPTLPIKARFFFYKFDEIRNTH